MKDAIFANAHAIKQALPKGKTFTLVGGSFDLIHVGHVHLLKYAASLEDLLVVAVLSDDYTRGYKEVTRPVIIQKQRALMVVSIRYVDFVYISNVSSSAIETVDILKPNSVVFGDETRYSEKMRERMANIRRISPQTKVKLLPRYNEEKISTSNIIEKIRS